MTVAFGGGKNCNQTEVATAVSANRGGYRMDAETETFVVTVDGEDTSVRMLTTTEKERLQGFEDGHTLVPYRGKPAAHGPRSRAIGNSMPVPCMRWVGRRLKFVDSLLYPRNR